MRTVTIDWGAENEDFSRTKLDIEVTNAMFANCNFNRAFLGLTPWDNLTFINCTFNHTNFAYLSIEDCKFRNCTFEHTIFNSARLDICEFEDCTFYEPILHNLEVNHTTLPGLMVFNVAEYRVVSYYTNVFIGCQEGHVDDWLGGWGEDKAEVYSVSKEDILKYQVVLECVKKIYGE